MQAPELQGNLHIRLEMLTIGARFSIKKLYIAQMPQLPKFPWKCITLQTSNHPRHKFILWLALRKRLATVDRLAKFGVQDTDMAGVYKNHWGLATRGRLDHQLGNKKGRTRKTIGIVIKVPEACEYEASGGDGASQAGCEDSPGSNWPSACGMTTGVYGTTVSGPTAPDFLPNSGLATSFILDATVILHVYPPYYLVEH
ncbi:hypothetical protein MTR67_047981 [Solanum verrucosum]|uniref:Reverse transcriptase zinc-binding domain-containing protein n=1 Tax=Solanum verrucosum TaxID=315347 RepID=A0AAF0V0Q6_SOLVR|nr:hypothetical protein MTR67_047981 [Solanum verrucosum]